MSNDLKDPSEVSEDRAFREHMGEVNPQDYETNEEEEEGG
jgi:hypothetical protein